MAPGHTCRHEHARFHAMQRLGPLPAVELWYCPDCKSTISVEGIREARSRVAAA